MKRYVLTKIFIKDLTIACRIGTTEAERKEKQSVLINITLWVDAIKAGETDDITQTVNYYDVYLKIIELGERGPFNLLERLAEEIALICLDLPKVKRAEVRVEKPKALKLAASAGVEIDRIKKW